MKICENKLKSVKISKSQRACANEIENPTQIKEKPWQQITIKEKQLISYLSENIFITAPEVNKIISDQKFAKSYFTSLRVKLVKSLNEKLHNLTKIKNCIIETKDPNDNRIKIYKVDSSIIKKKIGFLTFLFKNWHGFANKLTFKYD